jgi:hypothetical protein
MIRFSVERYVVVDRVVGKQIAVGMHAFMCEEEEELIRSWALCY